MIFSAEKPSIVSIGREAGIHTHIAYGRGNKAKDNQLASRNRNSFSPKEQLGFIFQASCL